MALVTCRKCGRPFAQSWGQCPSCGVGKHTSHKHRKTIRLVVRMVYAVALIITAIGAIGLFSGGIPEAGQQLGASPNLLLGGVVLYVVARVVDFWISQP